MIEETKKTINRIIAVILCIVILPVGIYAVSMVMQIIDAEVDTTYEQMFIVTDASVDQLLSVVGGLEDIVIKQVLSNGTVLLVEDIYWDYDFIYITVNKSILI